MQAVPAEARGRLAPRDVPLLTADLPGTGGCVRVAPEDFRVEEIPLYPASGSGDHLFLKIEKIGCNTQDVVRGLSRLLAVRERDVGVAGLKDRRAVAVQTVSAPLLPRIPAEEQLARAASLAGEGFRVLSAALHGNKLRTGHLSGNRFEIVVRGCVPDAVARAERIAAVLRARGAPNLFGPQRFGRRGDNAALGAAILRREANVRDRFLRKLALSALQAELFNRCLAARLADGLFGRAIRGDVLRKRASGGLFVCQDPDTDARRIESAEIDPAGPLVGHALFAAADEARAREESVVAEAGVDPATFAVGGGELLGARRPYRIPAADLEVRPAGPDSLLLRFTLPPGGYAASIVREIVKAPADDPGE
ncbi:MAG: tRNA pseudouridine(13) synthase TruD [Myxococcales bacterium]